jgi:hypothetical protein
MAIIETKYSNPFGNKSRGNSHPSEDLGKFFLDTIKEMAEGEQCSRESLLIDYRNAGGRAKDDTALFVIDLRLSAFSLPSLQSWNNGMVEKLLVGPDKKGVYVRL